jgi:hypothetical protein
MTGKTYRNAILTILALGLFFVAAAPDAMAQGKCRKRGNYQTSNYTSGRNLDDRYYDDRSRRSDSYYYDDDYYNREDTTGKAVARTAIGAGIGALGGALIGGKKGALIGAGAGAAGGYIYHRVKVKKERDRYDY